MSDASQFRIFLNTLRSVKSNFKSSILDFFFMLSKKTVNCKANSRVISGPFKNMRFLHQDVFGCASAKLLGTYEIELETILNELKSYGLNNILNIGGAEGYYAIGFASNWHARNIIVYETIEEGRKLIAKNAKNNNVSEYLDIKGLCTEKELYNILNKENIDLLVMDVEGVELDLLSPRVVNYLKDSFVLIESHDFCRPGCLSQLKNLFKNSHSIKIIESRIRTYNDFPYSSILPNFLKEKLMDEERPGIMQWMIGLPKNHYLFF